MEISQNKKKKRKPTLWLPSFVKQGRIFFKKKTMWVFQLIKEDKPVNDVNSSLFDMDKIINLVKNLPRDLKKS